METNKNMTNLEIAKLLRAVAAAYELKPGDNRFRIIAYQRAADAVEHASSEVKDLWDDKKLSEIPGIGSSIASYLDELFRIGRVKHFEEVMKGLPPAMFELLDIPGIGSKSAFKLCKELGITHPKNAVKKLEEAAKKGRIRQIEGFGEESEVDILRSIEEVKSRTRRLLLPYASTIAEDVVAYLLKNPACKRADPLGSLRRQASTVGDIDIAIATQKAKEVISHFVAYPKKTRVLEAGEATASILLPGGVQIDLMVQPPESYGSLLQHFTGSKHHNIALRSLAQKKGMSLSEYGIKIRGKLKPMATEEEFYKVLGMEWVPPELREDSGEIEAALRQAQGKPGGLPNLVELKDIKGDFHIHSNFKIETSHDEGGNSMEEAVEEAERLGYEYIAFSEHNPSASGHKPEQIFDILKRKREAIEKINYSREKSKNGRVKRVFNGLEIDIQPNGKLAAPDKAIEALDFAIASIHSSFRQSKAEQTKRVILALEHPKVKIFGHPTARKLNEREGVELDWDKIFDFCKKRNIWLEINAWPDRLDLPDVLVKEAIKYGVKVVIDTDSHAVEHMRLMRYGVAVARRGWATEEDVINTLLYEKLIKLLP